MNPVLRAGLRLGVTGRRWVAILGWLFVALPCLGIAALAAFLGFEEAREGSAGVPVAGVVVSFRETVRLDGNATRTDSELGYQYVVGGMTHRGKTAGHSYSYRNEGARRHEEDRTAWLPRDAVAPVRKGDPVTVYYDPADPWKSSLRPPAQRLMVGNLTLWSVATGSAGILLTALGWLYLRDPVEILVASPARADAVVAAAFGEVPGPAGTWGGDEAISTDVAAITRREGTTHIEFRREAGPAFRLAGLFPPALLLVVLVWIIVLGSLGSEASRDFMAWAFLAGVIGFIALSLGYSRARREIRIRNGVLEAVVSGLLGRRRWRLARAQVDHIEARWALSEVTRFGESAYFDLYAVRGDGKRLRIAAGLPRAEVADAMARVVARELGLAPEQALTHAAARSRDLEIAHGAFAHAREGADRITERFRHRRTP